MADLSSAISFSRPTYTLAPLPIGLPARTPCRLLATSYTLNEAIEFRTISPISPAESTTLADEFLEILRPEDPPPGQHSLDHGPHP